MIGDGVVLSPIFTHGADNFRVPGTELGVFGSRAYLSACAPRSETPSPGRVPLFRLISLRTSERSHYEQLISLPPLGPSMRS